MRNLTPKYRESETDAYDITKQVGHLLRKAYQTHIAIWGVLNTRPEITPTQFAVLCALKDCGPCSLTELGRHIVMDLATIRGIMERLSKRKLVSFSRDAKDRRQVIVKIEPQGLRAVDDIKPAAQRITEKTIQKLTVAERVALDYLLEKVCSVQEELPEIGSTEA